ncbi:hypothetical protein C0J52_24277 [Blattella germanica]|nr:hypothetical protein C0J52_24277 [Blattella germanica]
MSLHHNSGNPNWHRAGGPLVNYSALMQQSHVSHGSLQQSNFPFSASQMLDQVTAPSSTSSCSNSAQGYAAPSSSGNGDYQQCESSAAAGVWGTRLSNESNQPNWSHHGFSSIAENYGLLSSSGHGETLSGNSFQMNQSTHQMAHHHHHHHHQLGPTAHPYKGYSSRSSNIPGSSSTGLFLSTDSN